MVLDAQTVPSAASGFPLGPKVAYEHSTPWLPRDEEEGGSHDMVVLRRAGSASAATVHCIRLGWQRKCDSNGEGDGEGEDEGRFKTSEALVAAIKTKKEKVKTLLKA